MLGKLVTAGKLVWGKLAVGEIGVGEISDWES